MITKLYRQPMSEETKQKISLTMKDKKIGIGKNNGMFGKHPIYPISRNKKISIALTGKPLRPEVKLKISISLIGKFVGNKSPTWKGGLSFLPYATTWTKKLKRQIRERDKFICQICKKSGNHIHHIDYNKLNCKPNNLICLCNSCHAKTNENRKYWKAILSGAIC